jgi:hypothetical protein
MLPYYDRCIILSVKARGLMRRRYRPNSAEDHPLSAGYPGPDFHRTTASDLLLPHSSGITRRATLKLMGATGAALAVGLPEPFSGLPRRDEPGVVREMRRVLNDAFDGEEMGLSFSYVSPEYTEDFRIEIRQARLYPVASSFKAAVVLYYFLNTPEDEWDAEQGSAMYSMAVFSNNARTGTVLGDVAQRLGVQNPIVAFNDFATDPELLGWTHGLYSWTFNEFPYMPTNGYTDDRYNPTRWDPTNMSNIGLNFSTAAEIATIFRVLATAEANPRWESDPHFRASILASRALLGIPALDYLSSLEKAITYGDHYSKDGTLRPIDIGTNVRNDAGVWPMQDGGAYLISFMSARESDDSVAAALAVVAEAIRMYDQYLHPNDFRVLTTPSEPVQPGTYNYGFVRRTGVTLYSQPDKNAPTIDNPVRSTSIFGTTYLMYGAMVRLNVIDDEWAEVVQDDEWDEAFTWPVYIRMEDVQIVDRTLRTTPIGYVSGAAAGTDKFIILDVIQRNLTLFEGGTPIMRTPVILNFNGTPRQISFIHRLYLARDMPNYPGVPFTCFLHGSDYLDESGFAIHGAPWHLWSETVRQYTLIRRVTHGCINIPDWPIQNDYLTEPIRPDEFIFRWAGGMPDPAEERVALDPGDVAVRVYSFDNPLQEIWNYPRPPSLYGMGVNWRMIMDAREAKPLDVPEYFYEEQKA